MIYRQLKNQGEILNCDLTNQNSSTLDPYNTQHLLVDAVTDFYDRLEHDEENKDCLLLNIAEKKVIEENFEADEPLKTAPQRPTLPLIEPQRGNDDQLSIKLETLELEASGCVHTMGKIGSNFKKVLFKNKDV